jgi:soluble lytic murein transglycosylase-like protein
MSARHRRLRFTLFALTVLGVAPTARAELYSYLDEDGVLHFTNIPGDPRYGPHRFGQADNTFTWNDEGGRAQRVHRVDIDRFDSMIREAAQYYSLPASLVKAVVAAESAFETTAVSPAGAIGLMQLMPETARAMFVADAFDARDNIFGGARYLRILANRFGGDVQRAVAAYNAGPDAVEKSAGVPSYRETEAYVRRVMALYRHYAVTFANGKG